MNSVILHIYSFEHFSTHAQFMWENKDHYINPPKNQSDWIQTFLVFDYETTICLLQKNSLYCNQENYTTERPTANNCVNEYYINEFLQQHTKLALSYITVYLIKNARVKKTYLDPEYFFVSKCLYAYRPT